MLLVSNYYCQAVGELIQLPDLKHLYRVRLAVQYRVVDTKDGFWNVKLSDESSNLTTFWTPFGRYKFLRMPFGLKTASEEYQRNLYEIFQGLEGIEIIADDILILGKDLDIGQEVYVRTPNTTPSWSKANITNEHNTRSYDVNIHGRTYRRNRTWIKPQQASANQKSTNNQEEGRKESIDQEQTVSNCLPSTSSAGGDNIVKSTRIETTECRIQSKSDSPTEDEQLDNHVLSDVDIEEPAPDTMINRQTESSGSDRPQRTRTIPKRFDDYVLATTNEIIPKDYDEGIACKDKKHWENAMLEEIQNMYSHQVWELVPRPVNAKVVKRRSWYEKFSQVLHDCGLKKLKSDPCLFKWKNEDKYFYVGIYVDDFITVSDSEDTSNRFINKLRHHLEIKDVTCKGMFLGIKIIQDKEGISLQQSHYVQQILQKYGTENCKEVPTPGSKEINLDNHIEDDNCDQHTYQEALGMLMFLAVKTRPEIAYITSKLSQYSRQPKQMHWTAIKRVVRYLRGTIDLGVKFERGKAGILKSYTDASWSTTHDGKSYGGYVLKLGEATIDWKSSKQPLVALSTMEAEMIAACESCCQIKWIINLLRELEEWNFTEKPTAIYTDSQSLINWISSPKQSSRCRHINRKYHFLRDCYESRDIFLLYKPSQDLEADIFTKDLSRDQMKKHLENLSIVGIKTNLLRDDLDNYCSEVQVHLLHGSLLLIWLGIQGCRAWQVLKSSHTGPPPALWNFWLRGIGGYAVVDGAVSGDGQLFMDVNYSHTRYPWNYAPLDDAELPWFL
ncbi:hypothetical protein LAZ67_3006070 [Cordylochernes scorpioides]|uniref:Reverse transcriptase Ty1/copia-type domain-containing protein n=1 Tax=Cordylochernes scorpioides TaxID=51811 RepID=A0ABY6KCQ9_9ARAC|nr:hypothetical protein LAZ67_3006070 [Cordylochernes scorpioides]